METVDTLPSAASYLLSWQGTLLCRHKETGQLVQRPLRAPPDDADLVNIAARTVDLQVSFANYLRNDTALTIDIAAGPLTGWQVVRARDDRAVNVVRDGRFLCAVHNSETIRTDSPEAKDWEGFLPISGTELSALQEIFRNAWVIRTSSRLISPDNMSVRPFFSIVIGGLVLDLRWQLPLDLSAWPHRLTVLRDGWRIEQICRYRPLVFFSAFGNPAIMEQFALSVRSLIEFGRYDGDIAVLTDHSPEEIARMLPRFDRPRCTVLRCETSDRMSFMAARYSIGDWDGAAAYQPLLYADTDIVFDADVAPMLRATAVSDRIAAPVEPFAPLRSHAPVGSGLLQLDGCDPGYLHGFNSGTIGIPNLAAHGGTLKLIARVLMNHATMRGRDSLPYVDQEIANYVSYRIGHFDTALLARHVRFAGEDVKPGGRCGLVHFWPVSGTAERTEVMKAYVERLRAVTSRA